MRLKTNIFRLIIILIAGTSLNSFSQGCMGGGKEGVNLKGFIQPQYNYFLNGKDDDGNSLDENNFTFNRARLGVLGEIPYDIEYYFFVEMSAFKSQAATPHLLDAFVTYTRFAKWAKISLGQFKSSFGIEQSTGCSELYTVNRSEVVNQLAGPQRDLGMVIAGGHDTLLVKYSLGIMNGAGMNTTDNNNNKEIVGRLVFNPHKFVKVGGSFKMEKTNPTDLTQDLNDIQRFGGELEVKYNNLTFQTEYITGNDKLYSASRVPVYGGCGGIVGYNTLQEGTYGKSGYAVMAAFKTKWNLEPVVKYDSWDASSETDNDEINYLTIGLNYFVNDYSRVQINYVNVSEHTPIDNDMLMIQLQAKF
ncbi:MAG: hypothetical protein JXR58_04690 [Bacteroidales bacterium]|nr:hypothetical protein [Bacteroidales bacterium]